MEREGDAFMSFWAFLDALRGFGGCNVLASAGVRASKALKASIGDY